MNGVIFVYLRPHEDSKYEWTVVFQWWISPEVELTSVIPCFHDRKILQSRHQRCTRRWIMSLTLPNVLLVMVWRNHNYLKIIRWLPSGSNFIKTRQQRRSSFLPPCGLVHSGQGGRFHYLDSCSSDHPRHNGMSLYIGTLCIVKILINDAMEPEEMSNIKIYRLQFILKRHVFVLHVTSVITGSVQVLHRAVGAGTMHGFGTDLVRNPTIWLVENLNRVN